ncbi:hypothetical protein HWV62_24526 [Athelia sp. TMB]|nr:hypothetical protein HWV62_24526 [Athelia sp. TMB]
MKRVSPNDSGANSPAPSNPRRLPQKRSKSNPACAACKRSKTRCEVLEPGQTGGCHRCGVLQIACSFDAAVHAQDAPSRAASASSTSSPAPATASQLLTSTSVRRRPEPVILGPNIESLQHPVPPNVAWGSSAHVSQVDWLETPVYAIRDMTRGGPATEDGVMGHIDGVLRDILAPRQIDWLLQSFEEKFSPWLNLPCHDAHSRNAFLRLAKCLVASRLLEPASRASAVPRLRELAENMVGKISFSPVPSTDSILAMIVLALWKTVGAGSAAAYDERLIIAAAVSMAVNLHLNDAVTYLLRIKDADTGDDAAATAKNENVRDKARLWLCLTNVESMLCMGTGRLPLSPRTGSDFDVIEWMQVSSTTLESGRDVRLALSGKMYATVEAGFRLRFAKPADLDVFYLKTADICNEFDSLGGLLTPLSGLAVTQHEPLQVFVLHMEWRMCKLFFLHHCLSQTSKAYSQGRPLPSGWYRKIVHNGISLPETWGKQTLLLAQDILASAISRFEQSTELSTTPDSVFAMICSTAAYLVRIKIGAYIAVGIRIPGASDMLLQRTQEVLTSAACAPDHIPAQCAQFIATLVASYEAQVSVPWQPQPLDEMHMDANGLRPLPSPGSSRDFDHGSRNSGIMRDNELEGGMGFGPVAVSLHADGPDLILDSGFWASFMNDLTADGQM